MPIPSPVVTTRANTPQTDYRLQIGTAPQYLTSLLTSASEVTGRQARDLLLNRN